MCVCEKMTEMERCASESARDIIKMSLKRKMTPSIRTAAALIGKAPSTLQRWKTTNPDLYRAVMEYAAKRAH